MTPLKTFFCAIFLFAQILSIILISVYLSITSTCYLYQKPVPNNALVRGMMRTMANPVFTTYTKYTGAEMGYGFFAPNVISSGYVFIKKNGKQCDFKLSNQESWIRYMDLCHVFVAAAISDEIKNEGIKKGMIKPDKVYKEYVTSNKIKYSNVDSLYYDLLLKGISYRYMKDFKLTDTLDVQLRIYDYTHLADFKKPSDKNLTSFVIYEKKYFRHSKQLAN
jgi:hypothetical protein